MSNTENNKEAPLTPEQQKMKKKFEDMVAAMGITDQKRIDKLQNEAVIAATVGMSGTSNIGEDLNNMPPKEFFKYSVKLALVNVAVATTTLLAIGFVAGRLNKRKQTQAEASVNTQAATSNPFEGSEAVPRPLRKTM